MHLPDKITPEDLCRWIVKGGLTPADIRELAQRALEGQSK